MQYILFYKHNCEKFKCVFVIIKKNLLLKLWIKMYIIEFDRFGFMRLNKQCKQLLKDNILYGKNEITLER